jgi:hypothetical protein
MADLIKFPRREVSVDLKPNDIDAILECTRSLPGQWGARIIRVVHSKDRPAANWGYVFRRGAADDISPTISITRTSACYTIISWDLLEFAAEGSFAECCAETIGDVLTAVRRIVFSFAGGEDHSGVQF